MSDVKIEGKLRVALEDLMENGPYAIGQDVPDGIVRYPEGWPIARLRTLDLLGYVECRTWVLGARESGGSEWNSVGSWYSPAREPHHAGTWRDIEGAMKDGCRAFSVEVRISEKGEDALYLVDVPDVEA